jgi:nucleotide-binding universal stress UspA family protein
MPAQENPVGPRIVVGVDGSESSASALRWAIRQAGLTGATVDVVTAWHYPDLAAGSGLAVGAVEPTYNSFRENAEKIAADAISTTRDPASEVPVRARIAQGHAARVLLDASAGASLVVVGSRGHGGFTEALLGSVSQHCVQHALCPVVVVRGPDPA